MKKFLLAVVVISFVTTTVYAVNVSIEGNASGSQNNATIDQHTNQTIQQTNSATVVNNNNGTADTGNNEGPGIKTGDATATNKVINKLNSNNEETGCNNCTTPTAKPTTTPTPGQGGNGGGGNGGGGNGGNGGDGRSDGGIGGANSSIGGQIMGLSATGGERTQQFFTIAGTVCLILGSVLFNLKKLHG